MPTIKITFDLGLAPGESGDEVLEEIAGHVKSAVDDFGPEADGGYAGPYATA